MSTTLSSTFHSFAYGLIRRYSPAELYEAPLRLLSAPEQDVVLRELLTDHPESVALAGVADPRARHPRLRPRGPHRAVPRAREGPGRRRAARASARPRACPSSWRPGCSSTSTSTNLDSQGATDYADLIRRAIIEAEAHRDELRARIAHVFVDEYQDTDPGQVALLRALAGDGRDLIVVGDPHQSIYGFRGAEVRGILDFPSEFPRADGSPADVVALRTTRRFGPRLLVATQRVARPARAAGHHPAEARAPRSSHPRPRRTTSATAGSWSARSTPSAPRPSTSPTCSAARTSRTASPGTRWRSWSAPGRTSIPPLRRALGAAGVPVEVASDEVPLVRDPAVLPAARRAAGRGQPRQRRPRPRRLRRPGARRGAADRAARRPRRRRRTPPRAPAARPREGAEQGRGTHRRGRRASWSAARSSSPGSSTVSTVPRSSARRALTQLLVDAREELRAGGTAEEVLWTLWSGTGWPARLRRSVDLGGGAARRAHRDLDSLVALFDVAARAEEQRDHVGVREFLATLVQQQIPADTLAERGVRGAAVRLLTAHRVQGPRVAAGRRRPRPGRGLARPAPSLDAAPGRPHRRATAWSPRCQSRELLLEERRLFYVAVHPRPAAPGRDRGGVGGGRRRAAVAVPRRAGRGVEQVDGRPPRPLSLAGLVSELRRTVADPETSEPLRDAAARRLARLAGESTGTRALVPRPTPRRGGAPARSSRSAQPVRDPDQPVPVSASVLESVMVCPAQWFLARRGRRDRARPPGGQPRRAAARPRRAGRHAARSSPPSTC